jgi:thiamine biosynthesis lipoprotein
MSRTFRAMGTDVLVVAPRLTSAEEAGLAHAVAAVFEESEQRFSRFRRDSELSRLNQERRLAGVSTQLFAALTRAQRYVELTNGVFNPAVGAALLAAGYDRSFAPVALDRSEASPTSPAASFDAVRLDPATRTVELPPGVVLDFGGFIKGWTVDQAATLLPELGVIDAGGDAVLKGRGLDGRGWLIDVEDPADANREVTTLRVSHGAVATSAPNRRRWRVDGRAHHHLIDPATGAPSASDLAQVTVVAPVAEAADVLAKTIFILGARRGRQFLRRHHTGAVLVHGSGAVEVIGPMEEDRAA